MKSKALGLNGIVLMLAMASLLGSGCTHSQYSANRRHDLADVFTFTIGGGSGVKARVGPVQVAIVDHADLTGLRAGVFFASGENMLDNVETYHILPRKNSANYDDFAVRQVFETGKGKVVDIRGEDTLVHSPVYQRRWHAAFGHELFYPDENSMPALRGKTIAARSPIPFLCLSSNPSHHTQIEVVAGLGLTLRLGFNPGELLDFVIGFTSLDMYGDDL